MHTKRAKPDDTLPNIKLLKVDLMSTDVNVCVYSTSSLLFLDGSALQFRLMKTTQVQQ